jgi:hypothetical protein
MSLSSSSFPLRAPLFVWAILRLILPKQREVLSGEKNSKIGHYEFVNTLSDQITYSRFLISTKNTDFK